MRLDRAPRRELYLVSLVDFAFRVARPAAGPRFLWAASSSGIADLSTLKNQWRGAHEL